MKKILLIIVLILTLLMTGCGYGDIHGYVINKKHTKEYATIMTTYNGKFFNYFPIRHPESWSIQISKVENGETKTTWIKVSQNYFNEINIGDYYEKGEKQ